MIYMKTLTALLFVVLVWFLTESLVYHRKLKKIKLRVLVNGTRGKTSVTRLLAAALRASGLRVCAKTTGSEARWIMPEGEELDYRKGKPPMLIEQKAFLRFAEKNRADAIVVECMSLRAENQKAMARQLIRQHYTLITNAYIDHVEEIGWSKEETVQTLALSIYSKSITISGERDFSAFTGNILLPVKNVPDECFSYFKFPVYPENIDLILTLTDALGISRETAMEGMRKAKPDIGMHGLFKLGKMDIYNAFSANDAHSFIQAAKSFSKGEPYLLLYNHRADRPYRLRLIIKALCQSGMLPERIAVMGEQAKQAARFISKKTGLSVDAVQYPRRWIENYRGNSSRLLCAGNIKGDGYAFLEMLLEEEH